MEHYTFNTSAVEPERSVGFWADQVLPQLEAELLSADPMEFSCELVGRRYGGVSIARARLSAYSGVWRENARRIGTRDSVTIFSVRSGLLSLKTRKGEAFQVGSGEAFVSGPEALTKYTIAPAQGKIALDADMTTIPLLRLEEFGRFLPRDFARPLPRTTAGTIVNSFVEALRSHDTPDAEFAALLNSFTELVSVAVGTGSSSLHEHTREDIYRRALAFMRAHHTDGCLTIEGMAKALGVSERALFTAFDDKEATPHRFINRIRIDTAKTLLLRGGPRPNIMDVAMNSGFDNISTFNRQFRAQTGLSPSQYWAISRRRLRAA